MAKNTERTGQNTNKLKDEQILEEHGQVTMVVYINAPIEMCS